MVEALAPACAVGVSPGGEVRRHRCGRARRERPVAPEPLGRTAHGSRRAEGTLMDANCRQHFRGEQWRSLEIEIHPEAFKSATKINLH